MAVRNEDVPLLVERDVGRPVELVPLDTGADRTGRGRRRTLLTRSKLGIGRYSGVRPRTIWTCPCGLNLTIVPAPSSTVQMLSCASTRTVCAKMNP